MRLLRRLRLSRVDLVDRPANPGARVTLFKRDSARDTEDRLRMELQRFATGTDHHVWLRDWGEDWVVYELAAPGGMEELYRRSWTEGEGGLTFGEAEPVVSESHYVAKATKTVDGAEYPAKDFAYAPDPDEPSDWKLRLTSAPSGAPDPGIVGAAVAALGPSGFRGQKVQIPEADLPAVKRRVLSAWLKAHPDKQRADAPPIIKMEAAMPDVVVAPAAAPPAPVAPAPPAAPVAPPPAPAAVVPPVAPASPSATVPPPPAAEPPDDEIKRLEGELEKANKRLQAMEDAREHAEFVAKAATLPKIGEGEGLAVILRKAAKAMEPAEYAELERILRAANAQAQTAELFKQFSNPAAEPPGSWEEQLDTLAKAKVDAGTATTIEIAKMQVMAEQPDLRVAYSKQWR